MATTGEEITVAIMSSEQIIHGGTAIRTPEGSAGKETNGMKGHTSRSKGTKDLATTKGETTTGPNGTGRGTILVAIEGTLTMTGIKDFEAEIEVEVTQGDTSNGEDQTIQKAEGQGMVNPPSLSKSKCQTSHKFTSRSTNWTMRKHVANALLVSPNTQLQIAP
jgi:hypothetical protein